MNSSLQRDNEYHWCILGVGLVLIVGSLAHFLYPVKPFFSLSKYRYLSSQFHVTGSKKLVNELRPTFIQVEQSIPSMNHRLTIE